MASIIYLFEIEGYNLTTNAVETLYYGTSDFVTLPTDTPANQFYGGVAQEGGRLGFSSNLFGSARLTGAPTFNVGTIDLVNNDGNLDGLDDYAFGGRTATIFRVVNEDFANRTTYLSGQIETAVVSYDRVTITILDNSLYLKDDVQTNLYLGNNSAGNGVEGDADNIKDTPKPLAYGNVQNATPVLVNYSRQIYQIHDGSVQSIDDVFDGRTSFSFQSDVATSALLEALTVTSGNYATCLAEGLVKLGNIPQRGITVNLKGDNSGGYIDRAGAIVRRIVEDKTELTTSDLDTGSFTQFDSDFNYETGIYIRDRESVVNVITQVLGPLNYWTFNRSGIMSVGVFSLASGSPTQTYTIDETIDNGGRPVTRVVNNDATRGVPVWRVNYQWGRNYTLQTRDNVYTSVSDQTVAFTSQLFRSTAETDNNVLTRYPLSPEITVTSLLVNEADANTDKVRVHSVYDTQRRFYRFVVPDRYAEELELNDVIELIYPRFGLESGVLLRVTGIREDVSIRRTTIEAFG